MQQRVRYQPEDMQRTLPSFPRELALVTALRGENPSSRGAYPVRAILVSLHWNSP